MHKLVNFLCKDCAIHIPEIMCWGVAPVPIFLLHFHKGCKNLLKKPGGGSGFFPSMNVRTMDGFKLWNPWILFINAICSWPKRLAQGVVLHCNKTGVRGNTLVSLCLIFTWTGKPSITCFNSSTASGLVRVNSGITIMSIPTHFINANSALCVVPPTLSRNGVNPLVQYVFPALDAP